MEITREIAAKVLSAVDVGLVKGIGKPIPGEMCVEAAVCYAMGLPHGDDPKCVAPTLRAFKIRLNDAIWPSNEDRAKGLRRLALVQLGSAGAMDEKDFTKRLATLTIKKIVPIALRAAATRQKNKTHKTALLDAADVCEHEGTRESALNANKVVTDAATDAATADAIRLKILSDFAEDVVQLLIEMKVPGVQWLELAPLAT